MVRRHFGRKKTTVRLYHVRCPECTALTRNYHLPGHRKTVSHRFGREIRRMVQAERMTPKQTAEKLGLNLQQVRKAMTCLEIHNWKGRLEFSERRGPRSLIPPKLERLAAEREAAGMLVESVLGGRGASERRMYLNGRRCAVMFPRERPRNFEDEAPAVYLRRPPRQDWDFLIAVTSCGALVLNKSECPLARTLVSIGSGISGVRTLNWSAKIESWDKVKPVKWVKLNERVGAVTENDTRHEGRYKTALDLRSLGYQEIRNRRQARIAFLRERPDLWDKDKVEIVGALKKAGLISPRTYDQDVRTDRLVEAAKEAALRIEEI